jgi:hypothetical protein
MLSNTDLVKQLARVTDKHVGYVEPLRVGGLQPGGTGHEAVALGCIRRQLASHQHCRGSQEQ